METVRKIYEQQKYMYDNHCHSVPDRIVSLAKRKCGMGLIVTRLKETTCHCLAMSVLLLNLKKVRQLSAQLFFDLNRRNFFAFVQ